MKKVKNLDLWIILGIVTLLAIITTIVLAVRPYEIKNFDDIKVVNIKDYKSKSTGSDSYFVLLFDSKKDSKEIFESAVAYAEFARTNKEAPRLYVIDYRTDKEIIASTHFNIAEANIETSLPCLATISSSGSLSNKKTGISNICNLFEEYMSGKK
ncbi:MAG: hypothetical protein NC090_00945 [Anaeroplasma bactoclasticum]|nr:hypothetical protein [Anaeroplasma bactoclasticum]